MRSMRHPYILKCVVLKSVYGVVLSVNFVPTAGVQVACSLFLLRKFSNCKARCVCCFMFLVCFECEMFGRDKQSGSSCFLEIGASRSCCSWKRALHCLSFDEPTWQAQIVSFGDVEHAHFPHPQLHSWAGFLLRLLVGRGFACSCQWLRKLVVVQVLSSCASSQHACVLFLACVQRHTRA